MAKKLSLGRGLDDLFIQSEEAKSSDGIIFEDIEKIVPDADQYRKSFDDTALAELSESIKIHGVLQPLLVRKEGGLYKIIAGERRYRASKLAGLDKLPVIIKELSDKEAAEISLIENLQREDLNPIEEASGYQSLIESFGLTQEEAASRVGKSRSAVTNSLRLLSLPQSVQKLLAQGIISVGHAKVILSLKDEKKMLDLVSLIVGKDLSVRETEAEVKKLSKAPSLNIGKGPDNEMYITHIKKIENDASAHLGRKVKIDVSSDFSGKITLQYFDDDDLEEILTLLCGDEFIIEG